MRVGVAGATGALGTEIIKVLDRASWRPDELVPLARAQTAIQNVEYGGKRLAVDDIQDEDLEGLDALVLALPRESALTYGELASQAGVSVVDCSGAFAADADVPLVVPWVNPEALADVPRGMLAVPAAEVVLLGSLLGPLRRAGIEVGMCASVLIPASAAGRDGITELSAQVVALFNSSDPPRKVFDQGLAFDLLPAVGEGGDEGPTQLERETMDQLARIVGPVAPWDVTVVGVPVFSGTSAILALDPVRQTDPASVIAALQSGGVVVPEHPGSRHLPRPRRVEGRPFAHVGRVRMGADGRRVHLWASMDNLKTVATAAGAALATLLRIGRA